MTQQIKITMTTQERDPQEKGGMPLIELSSAFWTGTSRFPSASGPAKDKHGDGMSLLKLGYWNILALVMEEMALQVEETMQSRQGQHFSNILITRPW